MGTLANPATPIPQFEASDLPQLPTELRAGDSWNWQQTFEDYPSNLYALKYVFNSPSNRFVIDGTAGSPPPITADSTGQIFNVQVPTAQTACPADIYQVIAILIGLTGTTAEGQQVTLPLQDVIVKPNVNAATGPIDTRSFVKKTLDMIEACIAGNETPDVQEYMINGRQLRRINPSDLTRLRNQYLAMYRAELRAAGEYAPPRSIGFRFKATNT
ncbi:MAG: hypothetical protein WCA44_17935 [Acidobacteriaceae bacterium]